MMTKENGTSCQTPEENAEVFHKHFDKLYNRNATFDLSILDLLDPLPTDQSTSLPPNSNEIRTAIQHLRNNAPGESGLTAQMFKSIITDNQCFAYLEAIIVEMWNSQSHPSEWDVGRLVILPKKGNLHLPGNYRGIMLLEVAYKIVAIVIHKRLQPLIESLDHENQCGFRQGRGCTDAVFTVKMALKKRREHNLETWVLFIDLVKAFDRVPRDMLWLILLKFGVSEKLVDVLKRLHKNFKVTFDVNSISHTMSCTIGVKQGDILGPDLFVIYIAAIMSTWRKSINRPVCIFLTKEDFQLTGRKVQHGRNQF